MEISITAGRHDQGHDQGHDQTKAKLQRVYVLGHGRHGEIVEDTGIDIKIKF